MVDEPWFSHDMSLGKLGSLQPFIALISGSIIPDELQRMRGEYIATTNRSSLDFLGRMISGHGQGVGFAEAAAIISSAEQSKAPLNVEMQ